MNWHYIASITHTFDGCVIDFPVHKYMMKGENTGQNAVRSLDDSLNVGADLLIEDLQLEYFSQSTALSTSFSSASSSLVGHLG